MNPRKIKAPVMPSNTFMRKSIGKFLCNVVSWSRVQLSLPIPVIVGIREKRYKA